MYYFFDIFLDSNDILVNKLFENNTDGKLLHNDDVLKVACQEDDDDDDRSPLDEFPEFFTGTKSYLSFSFDKP